MLDERRPRFPADFHPLMRHTKPLRWKASWLMLISSWPDCIFTYPNTFSSSALLLHLDTFPAFLSFFFPLLIPRSLANRRMSRGFPTFLLTEVVSSAPVLPEIRQDMIQIWRDLDQRLLNFISTSCHPADTQPWWRQSPKKGKKQKPDITPRSTYKRYE